MKTLNVLHKLLFTQKILEELTSYVNTVSPEFAENMEIETFEDTLYITTNEDNQFELSKIFDDMDLGFYVRDIGNENVKFMINIEG